MINLLGKFSVLLLAIFWSPVTNAEGVKLKYVSTTLRLSLHHDYIQKNKAPDYWALSPYYVPQQDGAACGIASITMLLNASRAHQNLTASDALVTQKALVEKIKVNYSRGLNLDQLTEAVKKGLSEFGIKASVETIHADGTLEQIKKIRELLIKNEKSDQNFILANFLQSNFTGDPEGGGHISPVGVFDSKNNKVLIMDVDREYYEPYWVSFDHFIKGINTADSSNSLKRGLVFVELK
jgi:hypothetical protein